MAISHNLLKIKNLMAEYEMKYGRSKGSVRLLGASKGQPAEKLQAAIAAGLHVFGENYLQEAEQKMAQLSNDTLEWHFIGPIQSNKTHGIATHFHWVESLANKKIAQRLNDARPAHLPPLNCLIQVKVSEEETKSGVTTDELLLLAEACMELPRLHLRGLMTIPEPTHTLDEQRVAFHKTFVLWQQMIDRGYTFDTLSMGMSDDFEAAIAEGATLIRIGTTLFGPRV